MKEVIPEFSRPIEVARVSALGSHEKIVADAKECVALAKRLKVPVVHSASAHLLIKPWRGGGFKVSGTVKVDLDQESVVSLEVFRSSESFEVERYFLPRIDDESEEDIDVIQQGVIDIGEVAAETIGLELDLYPRKPGEVFEAVNEGQEVLAKVSPFAVLKPKDKR
jgi:uncharacterized metal-binding protein YceD (DUF177 family)